MEVQSRLSGIVRYAGTPLVVRAQNLCTSTHGQINGTRSSGRPSRHWTDGIWEWTGMTIVECIRAAEDKVACNVFVHGLRSAAMRKGFVVALFKMAKLNGSYFGFQSQYIAYYLIASTFATQCVCIAYCLCAPNAIWRCHMTSVDECKYSLLHLSAYHISA